MTRFSIITPFYKGNKYVPNLIKMAKANLLSLKTAGIDAELELIIVNDSPDITVELPDKIDGVEVVLINHDKNSGIQKARVTGLNKSKGDYIVFLDQDDEIVDDCILQEYSVINNADVVVANLLFEYPDGTTKLFYKSKGQFKNVFSLPAYTKGHNRIISPGHCLIRKSSIPSEWMENIMSVNGSDDLFLWILLFVKKARFIKYEKPLYTHKYTGGNLSAEVSKMDRSSLEMADILSGMDYIPKKIVKNIVRSRGLSIKLSNAGMLKKTILLMCNIDLYVCRIYWKTRECFGRFKVQ